jgi:hypothetical protein
MTFPGASARPSDVDLAFWLWIASTLVGLISFFIALPTMGEQIQRAAQQGGQQLPPDMMAFTQVFQIVSLVVGLALAVLFAVKMRAGRNWARIVITVFAAVRVLSALLSLPLVGGVEMILSIVVALLSVAVVVLMFRPDAKAYFASQRSV